ncbi:hypothetical protein DIPPA_20956 [Diplonema papillatum]|nr:hypothetical protein DIPPA_20956 [Diplonema papillatum]
MSAMVGTRINGTSLPTSDLKQVPSLQRPRSDANSTSSSNGSGCEDEGRNGVLRSDSMTSAISSNKRRQTSLAHGPPNHTAEELFPGEEKLQLLEQRDREWLEYRQEERQRQEAEDLQAYESRLTYRRKQYFLSQQPPKAVNEAPLLTAEEKRDFNVMLCIDNKKSIESIAMLVRTVMENTSDGNVVHLLNVYLKNGSKRAEESRSHLEIVKQQLQEADHELKFELASSHAVKDKPTAIVEYTRSHNIDMAILGMRQEDKGFFDRKVSPGVVDNFPDRKAVLLVPPAPKTPQKGEVERSILVCYDNTPHCYDALVFLCRVLKPRDRVIICNVVTPPPKLMVVSKTNDQASLQPNNDYAVILQTRLDAAQRFLNVAKRRVAATVRDVPVENINTSIRVLEPGKKSIGNVFLDASKELNCDMVVLSTRGIDGWDKIMDGTINQPNLETTARRSLLLIR